MRVCVFGGAGFIGSRVAGCLLSHGHEVVLPVRDPQKVAGLAGQGAVVQTGDLRNQDDVRKALAGCQVAINLAVPSYKGRVGYGRVGAIAGEFMDYVKRILDEAQKAGGIPVIISEGTFIWGDSGTGWHDETSEFKPLGMGRIGEVSTPYVQQLMAEKSAPLIRLIAAATYGATGWFEYAMYDLMKKGWYRTFGDGENVMSFVYIDDVAEAYRLAVEKLPVGESFAIVDDQPVRMKDFANCLSRAMGRPPVKSMPKFIGNLMAGKVWVEELTMTHRVRNTKAKEKLGWRPKYSSYEQGVPVAVKEIESR
ncbi:MAG: NAD-dependent epimerase/dehydratase family protein [Chloroflexi bacterium]|nr:NAD-dependent epimerase/dehydratase family protein [Chloroflexota bacterium]